MLVLLALTAALAAGAEAPAEPVLAGRPLRDWVADLGAADVLVREEALEVIGRAGPAAKAAEPEVRTLLRAKPASLRLRAALALWHITGDRRIAVAALADYLPEAPGTAARTEALRQLQQIGPDAAAAVPAVLDLVDADDQNLRTHAQIALTAMGPAAVPSLAEVLKSGEVRRRRNAAVILGRLGPTANAAAAALEARLTDDDPAVRVHCARALWQAGKSTRAVADVMAAAVRGDNAELRGEALDAVLTFVDANRAPLVRPVLEAALRGRDPVARMRAAGGLFTIDGKADAVLPILREGLGSGDRQVWGQAALGLAKLGPKAAPAVRELVSLLKSPEGVFSYEVRQALSQVGPAAVGPVVAALEDAGVTPQLAQAASDVLGHLAPAAAAKVGPLLAHANPQVRAAACRVVGNAGAAAGPFVGKLAGCLKDPDPSVRQAALTAFGALGPPGREAAGEILKLAEDPMIHVRLQALHTLERLHGDAAKVAPVAARALQDPNPTIRAQALAVLWATDPRHPDLLPRARELLANPATRVPVVQVAVRMGPAAGPLAPDLVREFRREKDRYTRIQFLGALKAAGPAARDAVPDLVAMLRERDAYTRQMVVAALRAIGGGDDVVVPAVLDVLRDETQSYTRVQLIELLGERGPAASAATGLLLKELRRPTWLHQAPAAAALARVAPERGRKEGVPLLEKWLSQPPTTVLAAGALLRLDPDHKGATAAVRKAVADADAGHWVLRQQAADFLGTQGPAAKEAAGDLRAALKAPQPGVRIHAAFALWRVSGDADAAVTCLVEELKRAEPAYQRWQAADKLGAIGPAARAALPELRRVQSETDQALRMRAEAAVRQIETATPRSGPP
jgi:HEAT repeat protein